MTQSSRSRSSLLTHVHQLRVKSYVPHDTVIASPRNAICLPVVPYATHNPIACGGPSVARKSQRRTRSFYAMLQRSRHTCSLIETLVPAPSPPQLSELSRSHISRIAGSSQPRRKGHRKTSGPKIIQVGEGVPSPVTGLSSLRSLTPFLGHG